MAPALLPNCATLKQKALQAQEKRERERDRDRMSCHTRGRARLKYWVGCLVDAFGSIDDSKKGLT